MQLRADGLPNGLPSASITSDRHCSEDAKQGPLASNSYLNQNLPNDFQDAYPKRLGINDSLEHEHSNMISASEGSILNEKQ